MQGPGSPGHRRPQTPTQQTFCLPNEHENTAEFPETSPFPHPQHCHDPTAGVMEKLKGFSKRIALTFPAEPGAALCCFSSLSLSPSLPAAPAELEISLSSSEADKKKKEKKSQGKRCNIQREGRKAMGAPGPRSTCVRLAGIRRSPAGVEQA